MEDALRGRPSYYRRHELLLSAITGAIDISSSPHSKRRRGRLDVHIWQVSSPLLSIKTVEGSHLLYYYDQSFTILEKIYSEKFDLRRIKKNSFFSDVTMT